MLVRIVKMTFKPEFISEFKETESKIHSKIRNFNGCTHLNILNDIKNPQIFFSYSYWESENDLNTYRYSDFFKNTWETVKPMFAAKAEAWSTKIIL